MLVNRDSGKVHGTNLTPKEYSKKNFPSAETTKKELKKTYDKEVPYYDSRGSDTLTQLKGKEGKFIKIDSDLKNYHNKRVVATAGKGSKDKGKYKLDYSKGSERANIRKKEVNMKDHYNWRDSFELVENQANRMKLAASRQKQNQGSAAQQFSVLKPKPIQGRISRSSQNMSGKPKPTPVQTKQPAPESKPAPQQTQASPAPQSKPQVSNLTRQGKERTPAQMAAAKRIASGKTIADVKAANTQSMRDRARARNAAFKAKRAGNTTPAPTQEKQAAPAPQAQQKAAATPSGDMLKAGSFGISAAGKKQAAANRAEVANI